MEFLVIAAIVLVIVSVFVSKEGLILILNSNWMRRKADRAVNKLIGKDEDNA